MNVKLSRWIRTAPHSAAPSWKKTATAVMVAALVGAGSTGLVLGWHPGTAKAGLPEAGASPSVAGPAPTTVMAPISFRDIAKKVTPAVVNVAVTMSPQASAAEMRSQQMPAFPPGSPFGEFFKHFFNQNPQGNGQQPQQVIHALGSGFIISPDGYIVTNNHVVKDEIKVTVTLADHTKYTAKVVGTDPKTDLALLKINSDKPLPYVSFGNSNNAETGDWVMAVGNPFGLGGTVTVGIVSARGRDLQSGPYDDFLQIDAPINRGNSGGPTFNLKGQVIGINTAIYSPNGGSVGIGFAIPSNLAKPIIEQLRTTGKVERGWLGVQVQTVTPGLASSLGLKKAEGALVVTVTPDSPAKKAGFKSGDVILKVGSSVIPEMQVLPRIVAAKEQGSKVNIEVWRNGHEKTLSVVLGRTPTTTKTASAEHHNTPKEVQPTLGMSLSALTPDVRSQMGIPKDVSGVLVTGVRSESAAASAGINPGDIIEKVGHKAVTTPNEVDHDVKAAQRDDRSYALLSVNEGGNRRFVALPLNKT